ncbi:hypothetical protein M9Y10_008428 [Tritrichomonas musculus]|uniref:Uncharacterized protein n=1 Tax=Tritrichomonas musculus TaxID=1915356 RepID=A0ABR2IYV4_9EUKA
MNLNSPWDLFVQSTLRDLHNGAQIPEYFGCLIPILTSDNRPVDFFNQTNYKENPIDTDDDFISIDVVKPKINSQKIKQNNNNNFDFMNQNQQQQQQQQYNNSNDDNINMNNDYDDPNRQQSSFSPQSWANPNNKSPPQQLRNSNDFNSNSYESPSLNNSVQKNNESSSQIPSPSPPSRRGNQRQMQNNQFQDQNLEEEQEQEQMQSQNQGQNDFDDFDEFDDEDYSHYAAKFREISVNVFEKYWYPMKTIVPRMTPESKLMATFKPSKFNRLKKLMTEAKKQTSNKLRFSRSNSK